MFSFSKMLTSWSFNSQICVVLALICTITTCVKASKWCPTSSVKTCDAVHIQSNNFCLYEYVNLKSDPTMFFKAAVGNSEISAVKIVHIKNVFGFQYRKELYSKASIPESSLSYVSFDYDKNLLNNDLEISDNYNFRGKWIINIPQGKFEVLIRGSVYITWTSKNCIQELISHERNKKRTPKITPRNSDTTLKPRSSFTTRNSGPTPYSNFTSGSSDTTQKTYPSITSGNHVTITQKSHLSTLRRPDGSQKPHSSLAYKNFVTTQKSNSRLKLENSATSQRPDSNFTTENETVRSRTQTDTCQKCNLSCWLKIICIILGIVDVLVIGYIVYEKVKRK